MTACNLYDFCPCTLGHEVLGDDDQHYPLHDGYGGGTAEVARARRRAQLTWPVIVGFIVGAGLGAVCFAAAGLWSLLLPTGLALLALAMVLAANIDIKQDG